MKTPTFKLILAVSGSILISTSLEAKDVSETLAVEAEGTVRVEVARGRVEVQGWNKNQVQVSGELDSSVDNFVFVTDGYDTRIEVEMNEGFFGKRWRSDATNLTIHMPTSNALTVGGVATEISINGIAGGIDAGSVSGDIAVSNGADNLKLETVSGDILVSDSWGKMKVASVSGDIHIDGRAEFFDAQTVSGDIQAKIDKSDNVDLTSVSGDIELRLELATGGRVEADTVSGDITLEFDNNEIDARFEIDTGPGGDIRNSISKHKPESSIIGAEEIRFSTGKGSAIVEISTMSGTIELEQ